MSVAPSAPAEYCTAGLFRVIFFRSGRVPRILSFSRFIIIEERDDATTILVRASAFC